VTTISDLFNDARPWCNPNNGIEANGLCGAGQPCDPESCRCIDCDDPANAGNAFCEEPCGNQALDPGEDCDESAGALCADGLVCSADCACVAGLCNNGVIDPGEACEAGVAGGSCTGRQECVDCQCTDLCGDGVFDEFSEQCDPPGQDCNDGYMCNLDCECVEDTCGNLSRDPDEECEYSSSRTSQCQFVDPLRPYCNDDCECVSYCDAAVPVGYRECGADDALRPTCDDDPFMDCVSCDCQCRELGSEECDYGDGTTVCAPGFSVCSPSCGGCIQPEDACPENSEFTGCGCRCLDGFSYQSSGCPKVQGWLYGCEPND